MGNEAEQVRSHDAANVRLVWCFGEHAGGTWHQIYELHEASERKAKERVTVSQRRLVRSKSWHARG